MEESRNEQKQNTESKNEERKHRPSAIYPSEMTKEERLKMIADYEAMGLGFLADPFRID